MTIRMTDFEQAEWACGRPYLSAGLWQGERHKYRMPTYRHDLGVVEIYEQTGPYPMTNMRFRRAGRDHCRTWRTTWGDRTLSRLAREFLEDVCRST